REVEQEFRNTYKEKAEQYDNQKSAITKNMHNDQAVGRTHYIIGREIEERTLVFAEANKGLKKEELKEKLEEHYQQVHEQVQRKQWTQFIQIHPEKAQAYFQQIQKELQQMQQKNPKQAGKLAARYGVFQKIMAGEGTAVTNK